jgi:hypothetical protein
MHLFRGLFSTFQVRFQVVRIYPGSWTTIRIRIFRPTLRLALTLTSTSVVVILVTKLSTSPSAVKVNLTVELPAAAVSSAGAAEVETTVVSQISAVSTIFQSPS